MSNENITSNKDNQININNINDESKEEDLDNGYAKFCENFSEISIEKDEFLQFDSCVKVFYIIPLLIFCLEKFIEKVLN